MITELPFQYRIAHFRPPRERCDLPFALGSATQHRPSAVTECQNSQDSVSIIITSDCMTAVVADGCSGTHPALEETSHSSNEVGAKLLAYLLSIAAQTLATDMPTQSDDEFLEKLSTKASKALSGMLTHFCGDDERRREMFAFDFLMATVVGFVVTDARYLVFHSGDGVIAINGEIEVLHDEGGRYLANDLMNSFGDRDAMPSAKRNALRSFRGGTTEGLRSIFVATDGFAPLAMTHSHELTALTCATPPVEQVDNGFDFLLQELRMAWNAGLGARLEDDATFALLRRIRTESV
jgi:hypothetical protein